MNYISKRNRIALVYVILLTIGIAYVPRIIGLLDSDKSEVLVSDAEISEIKSRITKYKSSKKKYNKSFFEKKSRYSLPPAKFNPNNYLKTVVPITTDQPIYSKTEF